MENKKIHPYVINAIVSRESGFRLETIFNIHGAKTAALALRYSTLMENPDTSSEEAKDQLQEYFATPHHRDTAIRLQKTFG